jgi:DNA-binding IclR family transcriptional regulator
MTRVVSALHAVRLVAERVDPLAPVSVGQLSAQLGLSLSSTSRLCAELASIGLLEPSAEYGSYGLGLRAIRISGRAAAPTARQVQLALAEAARVTGDTVCIAAALPDGIRIVASVESGWTLFVPAAVGSRVDDGESAIRSAIDTSSTANRARLFESVVGVRTEVAAPIRDRTGRTIAAVAVRLPRNRSRSAAARARRAVDQARERIEAGITQVGEFRERARDSAARRRGPEELSTLEAVALLLEHLAEGADVPRELWRAVGISAGRGQRLIDAAEGAGVVHRDADDSVLRLSWSVHGWHRAAVTPILTTRGDRLVAETSQATGHSAFLTVMRRMRSVTLVEKLAEQPDGLVMAPWLGRPCPLELSDGGPALLLDYGTEAIATLIPGDTPLAALETLRDGMWQIARDGVLSRESAEEAGQIGITAPVRDSSGLVVAAACIVGTTGAVKAQLGEARAAAVALAARVSEQLGARALLGP